MTRKILIILVQLTVYQLYGQIPRHFHPPLEIPMVLSGNFGEIRTDHIHSGIDIKTQGTVGHHVFAIEEGFVSRIKIQANGYGKSIYLSHPDGHTSVYGHLDRFREDIDTFVRRVQYQRQSHQADIYPDPGLFLVEKGEFIAFSGNTGGSYGPHLHFEIRNSASQHPTNVLKYGFDIKDDIAPKFHALQLYVTGEEGQVNGDWKKKRFELLTDKGIYTVPWGTRLEASGEIGIGVEVYDYLDGAPNRCGVYRLEMYVGDHLTYSHTMDEFSFSDTRYANARIDYKESINGGGKYQRLYRLPNDRLRIYGSLVDDGILKVEDQESYPVRIVASDVAGNSSELRFTITGITGSASREEIPADRVTEVRYGEGGLFENSDVRVVIPPLALYEDLDLRISVVPSTDGSLSDYYRIHDPGTPLHKPFTLSIRAPVLPAELTDKLILVTYSVEEKRVISAGGEYGDGFVTASLQNFGDYAVSVDTVAPRIIPVNGTASGDLRGAKNLKFTLLDTLSPITRYDGYIDNRWALFEYDPKNDLLTYTFDPERLVKGQLHELELYVSDQEGNVTLFHTTFTW
jgi:hypothetical protein